MSPACLILMFAGALSYEQVFQQANEAFTKGDYAAAARGYESLIAESIEDATVFFNLGNAYYRLDRPGAAIANYERALRLEPDLDAARENLALTLLKTEHKLGARVPEAWAQNLFFWHYGVSRDTTRLLAALCWVSFWLLLGLRVWRRMPYLNMGIFAAACLGVAFLGSAWVKAHPRELVVAAVQSVPLRYGPSEADEIVLMAPDPAGERRQQLLCDGDRAEVSARSGDWLCVETIDGARGWVPAATLVSVEPPYTPPPAPAAPGKPEEGVS